MSVLTKKSDTHEELYFQIPRIDSPMYPTTHGATVFARLEYDGHWYVAVALCHKSDQFSRKIGRQVARRRYFTQPEMRVQVPKGIKPSYEVVVAPFEKE